VAGPGTAIASYLLAPGFFHARLAESGADLVTGALDADVAGLAGLRHDEATCTERRVWALADH
jgi:hypothetical protein